MVTAEAAYLEPVAGPPEDEAKFSNDNELQPPSLSSDSSSGASSLPSTPCSQEAIEEEEEAAVKCSAVHTLERDMPDFDYSHLVQELKTLMLKDIEANPGIYSQEDIDKCRHDEWHIARFLLRNKLQVPDALDMMRKAMRFNHESLANQLRPEDFPAEFYQLGGIFGYEPDRKGNKMLYLRVALHKKTPEINLIVQAFIYHNIKRLDEEANGKGE